MSPLGTDVQIEREFRDLARRWVVASPEARAALEGELEAFGKRYIAGEVERYALVLQAWSALEGGDLARALGLALQAGNSPAGVVSDLSTLVRGAAERRLGHHREARLHLRPLLHKMLDDFATELLDAELCEAAIGDGAYEAALGYVEAWLRETAPGSRAAVAERVRTLFQSIPSQILWQAALVIEDPLASEARPSFAELLVAELARVAGADSDIDLARFLVNRFGGLLGAAGEDVARLAAETTRPRVADLTVGLLLSLRNDEMARRSAEVAAGVAFGLGLPRSGAHLVSRAVMDDGGAPSSALASLAAAGASVIVAGLDPAHLEAVARFARDNGLPVVLLAPPPVELDSTYSFVLGDGRDASDHRLAEALHADGAVRLARFGRAEEEAGVGADADYVLDLPCGRREAGAELRTARIDGVVVSDGSACGADVLEGAIRAGAPLAVGLGVSRLRSFGALVAAAGVFPVETPPSERLGEWLGARGAPPSFWNAAGRDAAVLAWQAVSALGEAATDDPTRVAIARDRARDNLARASADLWSSVLRGFDAARRVSWRLEVRHRGAR